MDGFPLTHWPIPGSQSLSARIVRRLRTLQSPQHETDHAEAEEASAFTGRFFEGAEDAFGSAQQTL